MDLKEQNEKLQDILGRLVALKNYKDRHGKDETYLKEQPLLWKIARETLYACAGSPEADTESGLHLADVSQRSELLLAYEEWKETSDVAYGSHRHNIKEFLKANNCG